MFQTLKGELKRRSFDSCGQMQVVGPNTIAIMMVNGPQSAVTSIEPLGEIFVETP